MQKSSSIKTLRTYLRRPVVNDVDALFEIENDPEVYKFLTPGRPFSREKVIERLQKAIADNDAHSPFGFWVAACRSTNEFVAWFMLANIRYKEHELGYVVRKKFWNQKYATEISQGLINFGFENGLEKIVVTVEANNHKSIRIMKNLGFQEKKCPHDNFEKSMLWLEKTR